jgi:hypothetical protein
LSGFEGKEVEEFSVILKTTNLVKELGGKSVPFPN